MANTIGYEDAPDAGAEANRLTGLLITRNRVGSTDGGIVVAGGLAWGAPGTVTGNLVSVDKIEANTGLNGTARRIVRDNLVIDSTASVTGNRVRGVNAVA
jgi:hypothetical protein